MTTCNIVWNILLSIVAIGFPIWFKLQADKELQREISNLSKQEFIHKLQFEKEFVIYEKLWEAIQKLQGATAQLIPFIDFPRDPKAEQQARQDRLKNLTEQLGNVRDVINNSKPFYSPEVYVQCQELTAKSISQIFSFHFPEEHPGEYYKKANERIDEMLAILDKIEIAIRTRIGNLGKMRIVG